MACVAYYPVELWKFTVSPRNNVFRKFYTALIMPTNVQVSHGHGPVSWGVVY